MNDESHAEQDAPSEAPPVAAASEVGPVPVDADDPTVIRLGLLRIATRRPDVLSYPVGVEVVTNALIGAGMLPESRAPKDRSVWGAAARDAYAKWQTGCQVAVPEGAEGTPDRVSLTRLGELAGFVVAG